MKGFAERRGTGAGAIPAEFDDQRLESGDAQRRFEPRRGRARMDDNVGVLASAFWLRETNAQRPGGFSSFCVHVKKLDLAADDTGCQKRDKTANRAAADDGHTIADMRPRVPQSSDRGLKSRCQDRALRRHVLRQHVDRCHRHDEARLVWMQHEHMAAAKIWRSSFDDADGGVAVFHRRREVTRLKGRAHPLTFGGRDTPVEDQRLGAPADTAVLRANQDLVVPRRQDRLLADLAAARSGNPESARGIRGHPHILSSFVYLRGR